MIVDAELVAGGTRRVRDALRLPPAIAPQTASLREAAQLMTEANRDAIILIDETGGPVGVITDSDLRRRVVASGLDSRVPAGEIASRSLVTIDADALSFEAIHLMLKHAIHHLVVTEGERLAGILADGDLLALHSQSPLYLAREIESATSVAALADVHNRAPDMLRSLLVGGASAYDLGRIVAEMNDRLVRRALGFVEADLGPAPAPYCWLVFASEARREQALKTDQDNGIVFLPAPDRAAEAAEYFDAFAGRAVELLVEIGFPRCPGNMMATNRQLRAPIDDWKQRFSRWTAHPEPTEILRALVLFDLRGIHGELALAEELRAHFRTHAAQARLFIAHVAKSAQFLRPPLGLLGQLSVERRGEHAGAIDLKGHAVLPLVDSVRLLALREELPQTNTFLRLRELKRRRVLSPEDARDLTEAYDFVVKLRARHHLAQLDAALPIGRLDSYIVPALLSRAEREALKQHFGAIQRLQEVIATEHAVRWLG